MWNFIFRAIVILPLAVMIGRFWANVLIVIPLTWWMHRTGDDYTRELLRRTLEVEP